MGVGMGTVTTLMAAAFPSSLHPGYLSALQGLTLSLSLLFFFLPFLGLHLCHVEVPRLGVESEPQLPAYTTATAMPDP